MTPEQEARFPECFNPPPALRLGETPVVGRCSPLWTSFNPPPALRLGETRWIERHAAFDDPFQSAPSAEAGGNGDEKHRKETRR